MATAATFDPPPAVLRATGPEARTEAAAGTASTAARRPAHVVPPLSTVQLAQFAREGFLVLPRALDPALCAQARDYMWETLRIECPRFRCGDPASWTSFTEAEVREGAEIRPSGFSVYNTQRFNIRCGADELFLDLFPRAMHTVAEQLLGAGTVAWPSGVDDDKAPDAEAEAAELCRGPCFLDQVHWQQGVGFHTGAADRPPMRTELVEIKRRGPVWLNASGSRGIYAILPGSQLPPCGGTTDTAGAHTDSAVLGEGDGSSVHAMNRIRVRSTAYIDDCPPGAGGLHVWPRSHTQIWGQWQQCLDDGLAFSPQRNVAARRAKQHIVPVECSGLAGTVVLWHETTMHRPGVNYSPVGPGGVIRQAVHHDFHKTVASVPDSALRGDDRRIWRDFSEDFRAVVSGARL
jgi:hypothetical protein